MASLEKTLFQRNQNSYITKQSNILCILCLARKKERKCIPISYNSANFECCGIDIIFVCACYVFKYTFQNVQRRTNCLNLFHVCQTPSSHLDKNLFYTCGYKICEVEFLKKCDQLVTFLHLQRPRSCRSCHINTASMFCLPFSSNHSWIFFPNKV